MRELGNIYRRLTLKALKWIALYSLVGLAGLGVSRLVFVPQVQKSLGSKSQVTIRETPDGQSLAIYSDKATPKTRNDELLAPAPALIWQNQQRFYDKTDASNEDGDDLGVSMPPAAHKTIATAAFAWFKAWETFSQEQPLAEYRKALSPVADPGALDDLTGRIDNQQAGGIRPGPGGNNGSVWQDTGAPEAAMIVLRYDGATAYVVHTGVVRYTGTSAIWSGRVFRRTYGILMSRINGKWLVTRSAAQTLGEVL